MKSSSVKFIFCDHDSLSLAKSYFFFLSGDMLIVHIYCFNKYGYLFNNINLYLSNESLVESHRNLALKPLRPDKITNISV